MFVVSILTREQSLIGEVTNNIEDLLGKTGLKSEFFTFDHTDYYEKEMGNNLNRLWLCFNNLSIPEKLVEIKLKVFEIEKKFSDSNGRIVNLDPGYLDLHRLVLASFKEAGDKIYLSEGIWAHIVLRYFKKEFYAPEHSFSDFKENIFNPFFKKARLYYRSLLSAENENSH